MVISASVAYLLAVNGKNKKKQNLKKYKLKTTKSLQIDKVPVYISYSVPVIQFKDIYIAVFALLVCEEYNNNNDNEHHHHHIIETNRI